jgi:hypothetical protein
MRSRSRSAATRAPSRSAKCFRSPRNDDHVGGSGWSTQHLGVIGISSNCGAVAVEHSCERIPCAPCTWKKARQSLPQSLITLRHTKAIGSCSRKARFSPSAPRAITERSNKRSRLASAPTSASMAGHSTSGIRFMARTAPRPEAAGEPERGGWSDSASAASPRDFWGRGAVAENFSSAGRQRRCNRNIVRSGPF